MNNDKHIDQQPPTGTTKIARSAVLGCPPLVRGEDSDTYEAFAAHVLNAVRISSRRSWSRTSSILAGTSSACVATRRSS
jgi:hypothetical protein